MRNCLLFILLSICGNLLIAKSKTIHIYVALCDNKNQGIMPVPEALGNGQNPKQNLYWGALYGVKTHFKKHASWTLIGTLPSPHSRILERLLFKHTTEEVYLLADAYDGRAMTECLQDFMLASNAQCPDTVHHQTAKLAFGGGADLVAFVGHNGLMDMHVNVQVSLNPLSNTKKDVIILSCYSKHYFSSYMQQANANPLLWTTSLMAPEAYILTAAFDAWVAQEKGKAIREQAAQTYNRYQKCGLAGARNLFTWGF
jgi:hypothetical protein